MEDRRGTVLVTGATGRQGSAVVRHLLSAGVPVRALTRSPGSTAAKALAALGADVIGGDLSDRASLEAAFEGVDRVFSVQNPMVSGIDGEIRQGWWRGGCASSTSR